VYISAHARRHGDAAEGFGMRMTLAARIRLSSITLAGLLALAASAIAGNPPTPNTCDETQAVKSRSNSESSSASSSRRETSISPTDESSYVPLSRTAPVTAPLVAPRPVEPAAPVTVSPRAEKPVTARKADASTAASRAKKTAPAPAPAKVSIPNLPATPGMGTLLRVGITAGREIS